MSESKDQREIKFRAWDNVDYMSNPFTLMDVVMGRTQFSSYCKIMQWTGLKDKNGVDIYEGDIVRFRKLEIEWQTHTGDNIPMGSYTEPCGIKSENLIRAVIFLEGEFTVIKGEEDGREYNWLRHGNAYERSDINYIFFPHFDSTRSQNYSDDEFIEAMNEISKALRFEATTIDEFISQMSGIEIIGNVYQNPELLTQLTKE